ncbi:hypothetical protein ZIOFF_060792 [Zingiber officinale]|uniref:Uncharacterized protein n=1 Tax=Zingiber officinale TaxID=94328 RepID=A0A8J5FPK6_ZINOF|nr:hypothetical protein ZIOFF_060792 [Zingiber officinale]
MKAAFNSVHGRQAAVAADRKWIAPLAIGATVSLVLLLFLTTLSSPDFPLALLPLSLLPSALLSHPSNPFAALYAPVFVESKLRPAPPASLLGNDRPPPRLAYLISGTVGDGNMIRRVLLALYHPANRYVVHLDLEASAEERDKLRDYVASHPLFASVGNVRMITKANLVTYRGPTMVANTLHAAAILLKEGGDWDWFINLSASDYPLVTQDDLLHTFSYLPRDLNFIDHTSNIGWKEFQRAKPVIIDPGLYLTKKADVFWIPQRRSVPTAFKLFTGFYSLMSIRRSSTSPVVNKSICCCGRRSGRGGTGTIADSLLPSMSASDLLALPKFWASPTKWKAARPTLSASVVGNFIFKYRGIRVPLISDSSLTSEALEGSHSTLVELFAAGTDHRLDIGSCIIHTESDATPGSAWMALSHSFIDYCIWGWDNLPRTVFMYYANFISSPEGYFHTVICNAQEFRNTTVNHDLHFISWDNPPKQHPHYLNLNDMARSVASNAPFARKFRRDHPILDKIDTELLLRRPNMIVPGGWCAGSGENGSDPCMVVGNTTFLRPGPGATRLEQLMQSLLSNEKFHPRQCK